MTSGGRPAGRTVGLGAGTLRPERRRGRRSRSRSEVAAVASPGREARGQAVAVGEPGGRSPVRTAARTGVSPGATVARRGLEMREIERSAQTVEEAVEAALAELGVSEQEAIVQVVQEPRGGFL